MLPHKQSGYVLLLDSKNRVRWQGSGLATPEDIKMLFERTQQLLDEK